MYFLAHEDHLRKTLGFPVIAELWGIRSRCLWKDANAAAAAIELLRRNPEAAPRRRRLASGPNRLALFDELLVHSRFRAAHDFASYLAATLPLRKRQRDVAADGWTRTIDFRVVAFLRLKAVLAAVEGGLYQRARAELLEIEGSLRDLPRGDESCRLLRANLELVWGRLLQLFFLPVAARARLTQAQDLFEAIGLGLPRGFGLLKDRTGIRRDYRMAEDEFTTVVFSEQGEAGVNIYGGLAHHYTHYLRARAALQAEQWTTALGHFNHAKNALDAYSHNGSPDPIRLGYTVLGKGRTLAGRGVIGTKSDVDTGLRLLLEARWLFRECEFKPGEYVAYRHYIQAKRTTQGQPSIADVPLLKEAMRLGAGSHVPVFGLESGVAYATALYDAGRPNASQLALREVLNIEHDDVAVELRETKQWKEALALKALTLNARENGVAPLELWGVSGYAEREREFVVSSTKAGWVVSAYGPPGSGRRLLLTRISEARGQHGKPWTVEGSRRERKDVIGDLKSRLRGSHWVVLYDLDLWSRDLQHDVVLLLEKHPAWQQRVYATLTVPLMDIETPAPTLAATLTPGTWAIDPLLDRLQDSLLLARGFLIRALGQRFGPNPRVDLKNIIFTGEACNYIRHRYTRISELLTAMRYLAYRLSLERNLIEVSYGRLKIPAEVIHQHLTGRVEAAAHVRPRRRRAGATRRLCPSAGLSSWRMRRRCWIWRSSSRRSRRWRGRPG